MSAVLESTTEDVKATLWSIQKATERHKAEVYGISIVSEVLQHAKTLYRGA